MKTSNWQLFLDDKIVARATGFDRVVHHPRAMGVVAPAEKPWETSGIGLGHVEQRADGSFIAYGGASWWDLDKANAESNAFRGDRAHL